MNSKEQKIKESYGEYYKLCNLDNDGYSEDAILYFYPDEFDPKDYSECENNFKKTIFRPKSLQGIEHNNGWIKIESEDDFPKNNGMYWTISKHNEVFANTWGMFGERKFTFDNGEVTHYQPIEKPKPPLY